MGWEREISSSSGVVTTLAIHLAPGPPLTVKGTGRLSGSIELHMRKPWLTPEDHIVLCEWEPNDSRISCLVIIDSRKEPY